MKTIDLIAQLQALVDAHADHVWMMGEHEIMIDVFAKNAEGRSFTYVGFSPDINIEKTSDGVYDVLSAWAPQCL